MQQPMSHSLSSTPYSGPSLLSSPYPVSLTPTPTTPIQPNTTSQSSLLYFNNIPTYELWKISPDVYEYEKPNINIFDKTLISSIEELQALQSSTIQLSEANNSNNSNGYYYQGNIPTISDNQQEHLTNVQGIIPPINILDGYYYDTSHSNSHNNSNNTPILDSNSLLSPTPLLPVDSDISYSNSYILFPTEPIQPPPPPPIISPAAPPPLEQQQQQQQDENIAKTNGNNNNDSDITTNQIQNPSTSSTIQSPNPLQLPELDIQQQQQQSKILPIPSLDFPIYYNDQMMNPNDTYLDNNNNNNNNSANGSIQLMNYTNGYDPLEQPSNMMIADEALYYLHMQQQQPIEFDQYGQLIPPEQLLIQQQQQQLQQLQQMQIQMQIQQQQQQLEGKTKSSKKKNKKNRIKNTPVGHNPVTPPPQPQPQSLLHSSSSSSQTVINTSSKHNNNKFDMTTSTTTTTATIPGGIIIETKSDPAPSKPPLVPVTKDNSLAGMLKPAKNKKKKNKKKGNNSINDGSTNTSHRSSFSSTMDILKDEINGISSSNIVEEEEERENNNKQEEKSIEKDKITPVTTITPSTANNNNNNKIKKEEKKNNSSPPPPPPLSSNSNITTTTTTTTTSKSKKKNKKQKNNNSSNNVKIPLNTDNTMDFEELPSSNIKPEQSLSNTIPALSSLQPPNKFQLKIERLLNDSMNQLIYPRIYDCVWSSVNLITLSKTRRILLDCIRRKSPFNSICYGELAHHYYKIKYYGIAEKYIRTAIILSPNNYHYWLVYGLIIKNVAENDSSRFNDAVYAFRQALVWYNFCYSYKQHGDSKELLQMLGNYAYSLYRAGTMKETVDSIIKYILSFNKNDNASIYLQCYIAYEEGSNFEKLITLFPKSYKLFPKDKSLKTLFAKILNECVKKKTITSESNHSTEDLLLFQTMCLDNGYLESAVYLCELAVKKDAKRAGCTFTLMNLYIIQTRYNDAIHACRQWLFRNLSKSFNSLQLKDILNVIGQNSLPIENLLSIQYETKPKEIPEPSKLKVSELWSSLKPCQLLWNREDEPYATIMTSDGKLIGQPSSSNSGKPFSQNEMEMLGVLFVLVKSLYLVGSLRLIPPLIKMIEPLRYKRRIKDIDYSIEANYYKYIAQLLCETGSSDLPRYMMNSTPSPSPQYPEITIIGDSHVLSAAWRIIKIHGIDVLLRVKHIDGLKAEYIINDGNSNSSYQHYTYKLLCNTIKEKSVVIFAFCEYDGMYTLLEKTGSDIYHDVVDTAKDTINKCLNEIKRIKNEKHIFPIVQPVLPISNQGRGLTKIYNEILKRECEKENIAHYVGLSDHILNSNSTLRSQYELDKVHIHPIYLYDVVKALESLIPVGLLQIPQV